MNPLDKYRSVVGRRPFGCCWTNLAFLQRRQHLAVLLGGTHISEHRAESKGLEYPGPLAQQRQRLAAVRVVVVEIRRLLIR